MANSEILLYHAADGEPTIQVKLEDETVWLNQDQMAELFQKSKSKQRLHKLSMIFWESKLKKETRAPRLSDKRIKALFMKKVTYY